MNAHAHAQIGHAPELDDKGAPAIRLRLSDVVAEYDRKQHDLIDQLTAWKSAKAAVETACSIGGAYGGSLFGRGGPEVYEEHARKTLLKAAWRHVYNGLNIGKIATAKDRKRIDLLLENPPHFTIEHLRDEFGAYLLDPRHHVLRGLAECFCDLDPAYKSHSKVAIGVKGLPKRVIISNVGDYGGWGTERLHDLINALEVYRGQPRWVYTQLRAMMDEARKHGEADFPGGKVRRFMNGNAHVIFDREGLLDINRALSEFYGPALADDAPTEAEARRPSTAVSRDLAYYPTPRAVVDQAIYRAELQGGEHVLEPSCGDGRIMDALATWHRGQRYKAPDPIRCTGVEYHAGRADEARAKGHHVLTANFLQVTPDPRFDAVIMNPPFAGQHWRKHVEHARRFLRPGGRLVAILPATAHYDHGLGVDGNRRSSEWDDLPVASFAESGTNVPTGIYRWHAPR